MVNASEKQILEVFEQVHGKLSGNCYPKVIFNEEYYVIGVACMKDGFECWRASLSELLFDIHVKQMDTQNE